MSASHVVVTACPPPRHDGTRTSDPADLVHLCTTILLLQGYMYRSAFVSFYDTGLRDWTGSVLVITATETLFFFFSFLLTYPVVYLCIKSTGPVLG